MSSPPADESTTTVVFDLLSALQRRLLLAVLLKGVDSSASASTPADSPSRSKSIPIDTLATEVTSKLYDQPIVTDEQCERTHITLVHAELPRLEEAGLVARETGDTTTVSLADHPLLETEWVQTLLETPRDGGLADEEQLDRTLEALQSPRRRTTCRVLARRRAPITVADLAALIAAREENDRRLVDVSAEECVRIETELVHSHLPTLADVGLVAYDRDERTVALETDAPQWRTDWLVASPLGEITDRLETSPESSRDDTSTRGDGGTETTTVTSDSEPDSASTDATDTDSCWTVEGAENVRARGYEIADSATEELLVTVPDDGILQQRCLERWRDAADRGVDVYVGSRSPQIRDIVRAAVPDATVCKPQLDWINFPADELHHGRVIFADRERVMLVTIDDDPSRDTLRATAITGEGRENALVSLVREHVGPRIDRLDRLESDRERTDGTPSSLPM